MILCLPDHKVTIRPVDGSLMPELLDLYRHCEDFLALGPDPRATEAVVLRDLASMRAAGAEFHGMYAADGALLGVLDVILQGYNGNPDCAYIELLMLRADARNAGLGAAVIRALEQYLAEQRISEIQADVQVNNPAAQRFWQRMGFDCIGGPVLQPDSTVTLMLRKQIAERW